MKNHRAIGTLKNEEEGVDAFAEFGLGEVNDDADKGEDMNEEPETGAATDKPAGVGVLNSSSTLMRFGSIKSKPNTRQDGEIEMVPMGIPRN